MSDELKSKLAVNCSGDLLRDLIDLIEQGRRQALTAVNSALTLTYWHVGKRINDEVLHGVRAEYGKQIVSSLAQELVTQYGKSFESRNLRRMMQFAELFPDFEIVSPLASQLSWSHFMEVFKLKSEGARLFYLKKSAESTWSKRELRHQIERKAFERSEIANTKLALADVDHLGGHFKAGFKGQMELYLNWLNKYERQEGEEAPIGLILCAEAGTEQVELLNMQKDNIMVAEYWTDLPPKKLLEEKLHNALIEVRERLNERKLLNSGERDDS